MCDLSKGVYSKGMEKGIEKGREATLLDSIKKMILGMGITADKAMDVLEIPQEKRAEYMEKLKN